MLERQNEINYQQRIDVDSLEREVQAPEIK
jgi:hypothetical protein